MKFQSQHADTRRSAVIPESATQRLSGICGTGPNPKMPDSRQCGFRHDEVDKTCPNPVPDYIERM
jgi:hypothetical protein